MAIKKSQLYSTLWKSCDELRGGMDASQYKDYVLFMLFIKYVSDKYADSDDFAPPITIPKGSSFKEMIDLKGSSDIGDKINKKIIQPLIDKNSRLASSDFPDFNDPDKLGEGKAMVDRLSNLISIFQNPELDFSENRAEHDDILGDAYEYLMSHFAQESGKSKGQFYTPAEVSRIIAKVIGIIPENTVASTTAYDPTCGSGSLLLKVASEAGIQITLEGQERDVTTAGLARMNMILHDFPTANILSGNTLSAPKFKDGEQLRTYDFVVANPPFSDKTWSTGLTPANDPYQRFSWGEPPSKQGDYAYLLHIIRSMKITGKGACILPHGVLFRGNVEAYIRQNLISSGILKGIIGLPANLFYGTSIPACILVLDKENAQARKGIFIMDASKGFIKDGNKNRLREQDIHKIVDIFDKQEYMPGFARMVPFDEITDPKNDYNLNLPRYIDSNEPEDIQDIEGHLNGGIPEKDIDDLDSYWKVFPSIRGELFEGVGRTGYFQLKRLISEIKRSILEHEEFSTFKKNVTGIFDKWLVATRPELMGFDKESNPKQIIADMAEDLLDAFREAALLDAYDVYQHLMDYCAETMQDDFYLIASDGWVAKTHRVFTEVKSGNNKGSMKDTGWDCDLIPKHYIVARYFTEEQSELDGLQAQLGILEDKLDEISEEHGGEEGVLKNVSSKGDAIEACRQAILSIWNKEDNITCNNYISLLNEAEEQAITLCTLAEQTHLSALKNSKGKVTLKAIKQRLTETEDNFEQATLNEYLSIDKKHKAKRKEAAMLISKVEEKYKDRLTENPFTEKLADLNVAVNYLNLLCDQIDLKTKLKENDEALDKLALDKYPKLSVDEIKTIVFDEKWALSLAGLINEEINHISQMLTERIRQLAERYETPLPDLVEKMSALSDRVDEHLKRMGAVWK
ncbi:N-6 DNA methylase [Deltaproteobacteria bacterium]|nr:N-6 DNA methylase [Deltaproteobacteria bacterium]